MGLDDATDAVNGASEGAFCVLEDPITGGENKQLCCHFLERVAVARVPADLTSERVLRAVEK